MSESSEFIDQWLAADAHARPVYATTMGLGGVPGRLGDLSAEGFVRRSAEDRVSRAGIAALDTASLPKAEQIDLALIDSELAGRGIRESEFRSDPATYFDTLMDAVFEPWMHPVASREETVEGVLGRLDGYAQVVDDAIANLDPALVPPRLADRTARGARGGSQYLREELPGQVEDPAQQSRLRAAGEQGARHMDRLAARCEELAATGQGEWALGETAYSALLQERELLGMDAAALHARGVEQYDLLSAEMADVARHIDPTSSGWPEVLRATDHHYPETPEAMRQGYADACDAARSFLVSHDLVSFAEGEHCDVIPSPVFERAVMAVAAYSVPPPFGSSRRGYFYVPYPPDGESQEGINQRLEANSWAAIPTTAVHEAYPGHHWHLTWSVDGARPVRKWIATSYFVEGWALYAERMMYEQGFFTDPREVLCHLAARIFRAARIIVDTSLHSGDMTFEEAVRFMADKAVMTETVARAEVDRYCAWPTQAASYLTGSLQIEALRDRWMAEQRGGLKEFHNAVAADPGMPVALVERSMFG